jgi:hypothetical protein
VRALVVACALLCMLAPDRAGDWQVYATHAVVCVLRHDGAAIVGVCVSSEPNGCSRLGAAARMRLRYGGRVFSHRKS